MTDLLGDKEQSGKYPPGFERWWDTYPKHRRREKPKCLEIWLKRGLEARASEAIKKLEADVSFDPAWQPDGKGKQFIPLSKTYLNGGRYDDDMPRPARARAPVHEEPGRQPETDRYVIAVNKHALRWLFNRGGIPCADPEHPTEEERQKIRRFSDKVKALAEDARELHERGELTDAYAQTIRAELRAVLR